MKQYDKIWVPTSHTTYQENELGVPVIVGALDEIEKVIVITVKELREFWDQSAKCQVDKETDYENTINFNAYLESKGVTIQ